MTDKGDIAGCWDGDVFYAEPGELLRQHNELCEEVAGLREDLVNYRGKAPDDVYQESNNKLRTRVQKLEEALQKTLDCHLGHYRFQSCYCARSAKAALTSQLEEGE